MIFASGHDHHLLSSFTGNKPAHSGGVFNTFFFIFREGFYDSVGESSRNHHLIGRLCFFFFFFFFPLPYLFNFYFFLLHTLLRLDTTPDFYVFTLARFSNAIQDSHKCSVGRFSLHC
jgi:hypothetical protein